jgi:hypothetical protein
MGQGKHPALNGIKIARVKKIIAMIYPSWQKKVGSNLFLRDGELVIDLNSRFRHFARPHSRGVVYPALT